MMSRIRQWLGRSAAPEDSFVEKPPLRILMVCTGNICRSPTAEGVLRTKLLRAGLQDRMKVDSAGTQGYHTSEPPDPRAIRAAANRGYEIGNLRARPLRAADYERFDWLLAMDQSHLDWLLKRSPPRLIGKVRLVMPFAPQHPGVQEVPDPYYGPPAGFEHVLDLLEDACDGLIAELLPGPPPQP